MYGYLFACYLTSTKKTGTYTIPLTTFLPAGTVTVKSTSTITVTQVYEGKTYTNTKNKQATLALTSYTTKCTTLTMVSTSTKVITQTVDSACDTPFKISREPTGDDESLEEDDPVEAATFAECCNLCFAQEGCNSYTYDAEEKECTLRFAKTSVGCETDYCPQGKYEFGRGDSIPGLSWGLGPCAGAMRS
ncbi:hypothetical protein ABW19_dt0204155 [Dactylella cylindrospora]|nr:hypothetical protein ABW19_dt0204155 [Dactylella cylindrospora]